MTNAERLSKAVLSVPSVLYLKGRLPVQRPGTGLRRKQDYSYFRSSTFWCLNVANVFQGLGFFIPGIYLPCTASLLYHVGILANLVRIAYARTIGLSNVSGTVSLSLLNAAAVIGTIAIGWLVDKVHPTAAMMLSSFGASMAILLVWGLSL